MDAVLLQAIINGLLLGGVYATYSAGFSLIFGVMGVVNLAHGELIMLGAYTTYVTQQLMHNHIELSLLVAIPAAFITEQQGKRSLRLPT